MGSWTRGQWALRLAAALGPVVALVATTPAGVAPAPWLLVLVAGLSAAHARFPDSPFGTAALGLVVVWWGVAFRDGPHAWAILAAAGLLVSHVAGLLAASGPDRMPVDPVTVRLWARRAGLVLLLAPALYAVAVGTEGRAEVPGVWVAGLAVALVATVVATLALTREVDD